MALNVGEVFVQFSAADGPFVRALKRVQQAMRETSRSTDGAKSSVDEFGRAAERAQARAGKMKAPAFAKSAAGVLSATGSPAARIGAMGAGFSSGGAAALGALGVGSVPGGRVQVPTAPVIPPAAPTGFAALAANANAATTALNEFSTVASGLARVSAGLIAMGAASIASLAGVTKAYADLEFGITNAAAISTKGGADFNRVFDAMEATAMELGRTTQFTAVQVSGAFEFMAMAGMDAATSIKAMPAVLKLASASGVDLARSADIATNVMSTFGIGADGMSDAVNGFIGTTMSANTNLEQLAEAMKTSGPIAKTVSVGIDDLSAAIGVLGNSGMQGAFAGEGLKIAMLRMVAPAKDGERALKALGVSIETLRSVDAGGETGFVALISELEKARDKFLQAGKRGDFEQALADAFGARGMPRIAALLEQGSSKLRDLRAAIDLAKQGDLASLLQEKKLATFNGQMDLMKSAFDALAQSIGKAVVPAVKEFVAVVTSIASTFGGMTDGQRKAVGLMLKLGAVAGVAAIGVGLLGAAFVAALPVIAMVATALKISVLTAITAVGSALAGFVAALAAFVAAFALVGAVFEAVGLKGVGLGQAVVAVAEAFVEATSSANGFKRVLSQVLASIVALPLMVGEGIGTALWGDGKAPLDIPARAQDLFDEILGVKGMTEDAASAAPSALDDIVEKLRKVGSALDGVGDGAVANFAEFDVAADRAKSALKSLHDQARRAQGEALGAVLPQGARQIATLENQFSEAIAKAKDDVATINDLIVKKRQEALESKHAAIAQQFMSANITPNKTQLDAAMAKAKAEVEAEINSGNATFDFEVIQQAELQKAVAGVRDVLLGLPWEQFDDGMAAGVRAMTRFVGDADAAAFMLSDIKAPESPAERIVREAGLERANIAARAPGANPFIEAGRAALAKNADEIVSLQQEAHRAALSGSASAEQFATAAALLATTTQQQAEAAIVEAYRRDALSRTVDENRIAQAQATEALRLLGVSSEDAATALGEIPAPDSFASAFSGVFGPIVDSFAAGLGSEIPSAARGDIVKGLSEGVAGLLEGGSLDVKGISGALGKLLGNVDIGQIIGGFGVNASTLANNITAGLGQIGVPAAATSALGTALGGLAGPIGALIGPMVVEMIGSVIETIDQTIRAIPKAALSPVTAAADIAGNATLSGAVGSVGDTLGGIVSGAVAVAASFALVAAVAGNLLLPFVVLAAGTFLLLASSLLVVLAVVAIVLAPLILLGAALAAAFAALAAVALLGVAGMTAFAIALIPQTEAFETMQKAVESVVDKLAKTVEPLAQGLVAVAGALDMLADVVTPFMDALFGGTFAAHALFEVFRWGFVVVGGIVLAFAASWNLLLNITSGTINALSQFGLLLDAVGNLIAANFLYAAAALLRFTEVATLQDENALGSADTARRAAAAMRDATTSFREYGQAVAGEGSGLFADLQVDTKTMADALASLADASYEEAYARGEAAAALNDFGESLTNVPQDFNVELARMRAAAGGRFGTQLVGSQNTPGAGAGATAGATFVVQNLTVVANDPSALMKSLQRESERTSFQQTGGTDKRPRQNIGAS